MGLEKTPAERLKVGSVVQMRKKHPCGDDRWKVLRFGADLKLECLGCERVVWIDRVKFLRAMKKILESEPNGGA